MNTNFPKQISFPYWKSGAIDWSAIPTEIAGPATWNPWHDAARCVMSGRNPGDKYQIKLHRMPEDQIFVAAEIETLYLDSDLLTQAQEEVNCVAFVAHAHCMARSSTGSQCR